MPDTFVVSLHELEDSRVSLLQALDVLEAAVGGSLELRAGNVAPSEILKRFEMDGTRAGVVNALARFSRAYASCRSEAIKALVDEEGRTLTDVARLTGHSRQRVSELYRHNGHNGNSAEL